MKSVAILALVAGASATFKGANPFTCPSNTDNKCGEKQKPGFTWGDLPVGPVGSYDNFHFKGWKCAEDKNFKRRGQFDRRHANKVIDGTCFHEKPKCPSFGSPDKFSVHKIHVSTEFDCDLEFHYDMPDGSLCRHRAPCHKGGSQITNTQCGGAKNVTIVYPPQPNKPKPQCSVTVTSIGFDCGPPKPTSSRPVTTPSKPATTTKPAVHTTTKASSRPATSPAPSTSKPTTAPGTTVTKPGVDTTTSTKPAVGTTTSTKPAEGTTTKPAVGTTTSTKPAEGTTTSTKPAEGTTTSTKPAEGTTTSTKPAVGTTTKPAVGTTTKPAVGTTTKPAVGTTEVTSATTTVSTTVTTVFPSTSTVFTTSVSTIISCGGNVPDCPGKSKTTVVTVSVPVSTTICSVTETKTISSVVSTVPPAASSASSKPASGTASKPASGTPSKPAGTTTTSTKPAGPVETLPCPDVVPQCLNTWLFQLGCKDNTDTSCYCPDKTFAENVFQCFYAHGASDETISKAITFYQGICAQHIPQNPAIVTGPTVTSYITVPPAPTNTNPAGVTTITISTTTVVPCTNGNGSTIPSSSTTVTIHTSVTVPKLGFTTAPGVSATQVVGVIPITTPLSAVTPVPTQPAGTGATPPTPGQTTTPGGVTPPKPNNTTPVVAGSGRIQVGAAGLAGLAAMAVVALL